MNSLIAGVDIGGTKIAIGLATPDFQILAKTSFPTSQENSPEKTIDRIISEIKDFEKQKQGEVKSVGIGCCGPLDLQRGLVLSPPNLTGWNNFPIVENLQAKMKIPVTLENDANAAALGEQKFGAAKKFRNFIYLTISTGIGGGIINHKIVHGLTGNAGELGHLTVMPDGPKCGCGSFGCLEAICSGTGIARRFNEKIKDGHQSVLVDKGNQQQDFGAFEIAEAAAQGDRLAAEIWEETCFYLSVGIGNMIVFLEPEAIIIGGGVSIRGEQLFRPLRQMLRNQVKIFSADQIEILAAKLGSESSLYGALVLNEVVK